MSTISQSIWWGSSFKSTQAWSTSMNIRNLFWHKSCLQSPECKILKCFFLCRFLQFIWWFYISSLPKHTLKLYFYGSYHAYVYKKCFPPLNIFRLALKKYSPLKGPSHGFVDHIFQVISRACWVNAEMISPYTLSQGGNHFVVCSVNMEIVA
jgi:hypothetical protein